MSDVRKIYRSHLSTKIGKLLDDVFGLDENRYVTIEHKSDDWPQRVLLNMQSLIAEYGAYLFREGKAKTTARKYLKDLVQFSNEHRILTLQDLTRESVSRWILTLRQRNLTNGTIANHLWALKSFLNFVEKEKKIACFKWDLSIPRVPPPESVEYLETDELDQLFSLLDETNVHDLRLRAFIEVMINTGMRPFETLSLKRSDVSSQPDEVDIIGKGKKKRVVYFNERAYYWLERYLTARKDNSAALFVVHNGMEEVRMLSLRTIEGSFQKLVKKSGLQKKVVLHTLRHTFATLYAGNGCAPDYIAKMLGHSNPKTTRKYYMAVTQKHTKEAYVRYNPFVSGGEYKGLPSVRTGLSLIPTN